MRSKEYMFTFEMTMNINGKGINEGSFMIIESVSARTKKEAIDKITKENNELGYVTLKSNLLDKESSIKYQKRTNLQAINLVKYLSN